MATTNRILDKRLAGLGINSIFDEEQNVYLCQIEYHDCTFDLALRVDVNGNNVLMRTLGLYQVMQHRNQFLEFVAEQNFQTKLLKLGLTQGGELVAQIDLFLGPEKLTQGLFDTTFSIYLELLTDLMREIKLLEVANMTPIVRA